MFPFRQVLPIKKITSKQVQLDNFMVVTGALKYFDSQQTTIRSLEMFLTHIIEVGLCLVALGGGRHSSGEIIFQPFIL